MAAPARLTGTVAKWFDRGYGYVAPDDGGDDLFVHRVDLERAGVPQQVGQRVSFVLGRNHKGQPRAERVRAR